MLGLIDYDIIGYEWGFKNEGASEEEALESVDLFINFLNMRLMLSDYKGYFTGDGNYREDAATIQPYKGNRNQEKPIHYQAIKDYLISEHGGVVVDGMEADDALGIEQTLVPDSIIITRDKDLRMIPGMKYYWAFRDGHESLFEVIEPEGMNFFYHQILTGDSGDHVPGLFKCTGTKASAKIKQGLNEATDKEEYILKTWIAAHYKAFSDAKVDRLDESMVRERCIKEINEIGTLLWIQREKGVIWKMKE